VAEENVTRKLTTILAADVEGYTRLMRADEEATLRTLGEYRDVIDGLVARHDGRVFSTGGDSVLAEFGSVVEAVRCAISCQEEISSRNAELADDRKLMFRIGINVGDVMVRDGDLFGDGVNVAARLEGLAEAGGVCISGSVFEQIKHKLSLGFEDMGQQEVKNIAEPISAYRLVPGQASAAATKATKPSDGKRWRMPAIAVVVAVLAAIAGGALWWQSWAPDVEPASLEKMVLPLPDKPSIAVLPFDNISNDSDQEYFVEGIAEDIITDLSQISGLFVIARNSSFVYKGRAVDVHTVAEELGVRFVLEGSVRKVGAQVRINAQLIDATTGGHLWAARYDGSLDDVFALQDKVTSEIVAQLKIKLTHDQQNRRERRGTDNADAHDAYLRGSQFYRRYTPEDFSKAIPHLEQAVELDPDYGSAWATLASIYWITYQRGHSWSRIVNPNWNNMISWQGARNKAERYLKQAMRSPTPLAHQIESQFSWEYRQFDRALKEAKQAVALDQNDPAGHLALAWTLIFAGRAEVAIASTETGVRLDPNFPGSYLFALGTAQLMLERYDAAETTLKRALAFSPEDLEILAPLTIAYARTGKQEEAKATLQKYTDVWILWGKKIETYMTWWPFKHEADIRLFGGGLIKAGLCCEESFEEYISRLRKGGTLE
jgi:TolB-like protein/class 3 adenylate cyclase/Flp pilus assembly protein TadD